MFVNGNYMIRDNINIMLCFLYYGDCFIPKTLISPVKVEYLVDINSDDIVLDVFFQLQRLVT